MRYADIPILIEAQANGVRFWKNPTVAGLRNLVRAGPLKGCVSDNDIFIWDAHGSWHHQMKLNLGIDPNTRDGADLYFMPEGHPAETDEWRPMPYQDGSGIRLYWDLSTTMNPTLGRLLSRIKSAVAA